MQETLVSNEDDCFDNALSACVWQRKYRYTRQASGQPEASVRDTWQCVARAVASVESTHRPHWKRCFREMLDGFRFLPAGRILASAGTDYDATLFNCFVMGTIDDSIDGVFERLRESAVTMQRGGGIGCDFSTLRPAGPAPVSRRREASPFDLKSLRVNSQARRRPKGAGPCTMARVIQCLRR